MHKGVLVRIPTVGRLRVLWLLGIADRRRRIAVRRGRRRGRAIRRPGCTIVWSLSRRYTLSVGGWCLMGSGLRVHSRRVIRSCSLSRTKRGLCIRSSQTSTISSAPGIRARRSPLGIWRISALEAALVGIIDRRRLAGVRTMLRTLATMVSVLPGSIVWNYGILQQLYHSPGTKTLRVVCMRRRDQAQQEGNVSRDGGGCHTMRRHTLATLLVEPPASSTLQGRDATLEFLRFATQHLARWVQIVRIIDWEGSLRGVGTPNMMRLGARAVMRPQNLWSWRVLNRDRPLLNR